MACHEHSRILGKGARNRPQPSAKRQPGLPGRHISRKDERLYQPIQQLILYSFSDLFEKRHGCEDNNSPAFVNFNKPKTRTMKTLYIVRHAKSSWDNASLGDADRPLNDRGKRDAPRMAKRLKERDVAIDLMLSSPARRAISTCKRMSGVLKYPEENIKISKSLYHSGDDGMLEVVQNLNDNIASVMIVGHNPGLTDFVNSLTNKTIANVPTCGIVACAFDVDSWKGISWGKGEMLFFDYPKSKGD
jgi:phosphohistidine phosphatase